MGVFFSYYFLLRGGPFLIVGGGAFLSLWGPFLGIALHLLRKFLHSPMGICKVQLITTFSIVNVIVIASSDLASGSCTLGIYPPKTYQVQFIVFLH